MLKYVLTSDDVFIFIKWQNKKSKHVAQLVKNPPAMQKTWFDSWVGMIHWRREQQLTPVFLPGEFHGQRSLAGYSPWCCRVRHNMTEHLTLMQYVMHLA